MQPERRIDKGSGCVYPSVQMANLKQKFEQAALELASAKQRLGEAQNHFDALYKQVVGGVRSRRNIAPVLAATPATDAGQVSGERATDRIESVLCSNPAKAWKYTELSKKLPDIPAASIRALLFKLQRGRKATKVGRGLWKAPESMPT